MNLVSVSVRARLWIFYGLHGKIADNFGFCAHCAYDLIDPIRNAVAVANDAALINMAANKNHFGNNRWKRLVAAYSMPVDRFKLEICQLPNGYRFDFVAVLDRFKAGANQGRSMRVKRYSVCSHSHTLADNS